MGHWFVALLTHGGASTHETLPSKIFILKMITQKKNHVFYSVFVVLYADVFVFSLM